jgi:hypothetical protein
LTSEYVENLEEFRNAAETHANDFQNVVMSIKHMTNVMKLDFEKMKLQLNDLELAIGGGVNTKDLHLNLHHHHGMSLHAPMNTQRAKESKMHSGERGKGDYSSPLEKKLASFQKTADQRKRNNPSLSNSRSKPLLGATPSHSNLNTKPSGGS